MADQGARCSALIFGVEKSMLYHRSHAAAMRMVSRTITFLSVLGGTAVVATITGEKSAAATVLGVAIAILGSIQLVFDVDGKVRENETALQEFTRLRKSINECPTFREEQLIEWENTRREIEAGFVAELDALNVRCHNILCEARGHSNALRHIGAIQRLVIHFFSWQSEFPLESDHRAKHLAANVTP